MKQATPTKPRSSYKIGRAGFAKISAIEGIELSPAMREDFEDFERRQLSPEERRRTIAKKYGKAR